MDIAMTELCQELRNWFERESYTGHIALSSDGAVLCNGKQIPLLNGQYYRVSGSVFADGVHIYPDDETVPEEFSGAVLAMAVPLPVIQLATDIASWRNKYEGVDSQAMSPYMSESFGGYSYTKGSAYTGAGSGGGTNWKATFKSRLTPWRKI